MVVAFLAKGGCEGVLFQMVGEGDAQFRGCQSYLLIVGQVWPRGVFPVMEIAVEEYARTDGGLHTPTAVQGYAIAVGQTCCHRIAFVAGVFDLEFISSTESVEPQEMACLWARRKPVAHFGLESYELGAEFIKLERVAIGFQSDCKGARHTKFYT